jgi:hypothetical protein
LSFESCSSVEEGFKLHFPAHLRLHHEVLAEPPEEEKNSLLQFTYNTNFNQQPEQIGDPNISMILCLFKPLVYLSACGASASSSEVKYFYS